MVGELARVTRRGGIVAALNEGTRAPYRSGANPEQEHEKELGINEHVHTMWAYAWAFTRAGLRPLRLEYAEGPDELRRRKIAGKLLRLGELPATLWALNAYPYAGLSFFARRCPRAEERRERAGDRGDDEQRPDLQEHVDEPPGRRHRVAHLRRDREQLHRREEQRVAHRVDVRSDAVVLEPPDQHRAGQVDEQRQRAPRSRSRATSARCRSSHAQIASSSSRITLQSFPAQSDGRFPGRERHRPEVRRHVGCGPRRDQARRASRLRDRPGGEPGLRRRLGDGRHDRPARRPRTAGVEQPGSARARHAADRRRAHLGRARLDGDQRPRPQRRLVHRLAGRDRDRHEPRQGAHRRDAARPRARGARRGPDRDRGRLPGRLDRQGRDHARPRRLRHDRRRARGRARRRRLRDLHRRRRRVHGRPAHLPERAQAVVRLVRGDARARRRQARAC